MTDQDLLDEYALDLGLPKPIDVSGLIASHKVLMRSMRALQINGGVTVKEPLSNQDDYLQAGEAYAAPYDKDMRADIQNAFWAGVRYELSRGRK